MQMLPRGPWDLQWGHTSGCCQKSLGGWQVGLVGRWLIGRVRIVARTLVGVTLLYVEGPAAGGGEPAVGLVKTRAMVEVGQVLE
jgi:hypothetical protein